MSRRHAAEKREILPDAKYGDRVLSKFMNNLIKEINERKLKRAQEENDRRIKENEEEVLNSIDEILGDING